MGWIKTHERVYQNIFRTHKLVVFSSFTNLQPSELSATPEIMTTWCLDQSKSPLIKVVKTWEHGGSEETVDYQFYIYFDDGEWPR